MTCLRSHVSPNAESPESQPNSLLPKSSQGVSFRTIPLYPRHTHTGTGLRVKRFLGLRGPGTSLIAPPKVPNLGHRFQTALLSLSVRLTSM